MRRLEERERRTGPRVVADHDHLSHTCLDIDPIESCPIACCMSGGRIEQFHSQTVRVRFHLYLLIPGPFRDWQTLGYVQVPNS
jgi:hypothetical protein